MAKQELTVIEANLSALDKIAGESNALATTAKNSFAAALVYSIQVQKIEALLSPEVMAQAILPLANKDFGWREDKPGSYSVEEIKNVFVSAVLHGALPVNDEVLVISKRMYLQKNHFRRKVREFPGLTDLVLLPGKISLLPNGALAEMTATWKLNGKEQKIERIGSSAIPIRLNAGQGADAAIGKAERKILAAIYTQLTGSDIGDEEPEDLSDLTPAKAKEVESTATVVEEKKPQNGTEAVKAALKEKKKTAAAPAPAEADDGVTPWSEPESDAPSAEEIAAKKAQADAVINAAAAKQVADAKAAEAASVIKKAKDAAKPSAGSKTVGAGKPKEVVVEAAPAAPVESKKDEAEIEQVVHTIMGIYRQFEKDGTTIKRLKCTDENADQYYIPATNLELGREIMTKYQGNKKFEPKPCLISVTTDASGERWICDAEDPPAAPEKDDSNDDFSDGAEGEAQ